MVISHGRIKTATSVNWIPGGETNIVFFLNMKTVEDYTGQV